MPWRAARNMRSVACPSAWTEASPSATIRNAWPSLLLPDPSPIAWLLAPALLLFVLFFVLPFGVMAAMSFFSANPVTNPNAFLTTRHYERFIFDSAGIFHDALWATLRIGLITTVVSLLIGYPLAHWMARMQSRLGHALVLMAVIAPMLTGIVVRTFAWMTILQDKGVINTLLIAVGRDREAAAADVQRVRHHRGAGPYLRALHGADPDRRDRPHRRAAGTGGAQPGRRPPARLRRGHPAAQPARHPGRLAAGLRAVDQRLCHALADGRHRRADACPC